MRPNSRLKRICSAKIAASSWRTSTRPRAVNSRSPMLWKFSASMLAAPEKSGTTFCANTGGAASSDGRTFSLEFPMIHADARRAAVERWVAAQLPGARFTLEPASEDASFRRYWRARVADGRTYVVMDAPPDKEDCRPFVHVGGLLRAAGVNAPEIFAQQLASGFLLLGDLGNTTYLQAI